LGVVQEVQVVVWVGRRGVVEYGRERGRKCGEGKGERKREGEGFPT
jgi:hypothetical protein